jgi:predicted RecA/RadA family phage recombinase
MKGFDPSTGLGYIQEGDYIQVTLPYARKAGEGVLIGSLFGVCVVDGAQGDSINIHTEGVYGLTAATGASTDATEWAKAYWDNSAKKITPVSTNNSYVGVFAAAKATTDAAARVRLNEFVV